MQSEPHEDLYGPLRQVMPPHGKPTLPSFGTTIIAKLLNCCPQAEWALLPPQQVGDLQKGEFLKRSVCMDDLRSQFWNCYFFRRCEMFEVRLTWLRLWRLYNAKMFSKDNDTRLVLGWGQHNNNRSGTMSFDKTRFLFRRVRVRCSLS